MSRSYEIYYYNDVKGYNVKEHAHNYYEFYFFLEGDVTINISGKVYKLNVGDILLIPPKVKHYATVGDTNKTYRRFVFWVSQEYINQLMDISKDYGYIMQYVLRQKEYVFPQDVITFNEIQSKVFRLLSEVHSNRFGRDSQIQICIQDLLLIINRKVYESRHPVNKSRSTTLYQNLLLYIEEHLDEDLSLERLAKEYFVSKYHIAHMFKENSGVPLHQYITKKRLSLCSDAILTNSGITDIYQQFGFGDYTSFYRAFKKEFGMSPREYREAHMGIDDMETTISGE